MLYRATGNLLYLVPAGGPPVIRRGPRNTLESRQSPKPVRPTRRRPVPASTGPDPEDAGPRPAREGPPGGELSQWRRISYWWVFTACELRLVVDAYLR